MHSLKSSAGRALQCLLWIPVPALSWPHLGFALCSGVTCHNDNMHLASLSRLLRFWISEECQSPLRVFFSFSLYFFPPFFSHIQCELQDSFQVFLHFVRIGKRLSKILSFFNLFILFYLSKFLNFIFHFSTINCLHVLQCSFSPIPDQKFSGTKAKRRNEF